MGSIEVGKLADLIILDQNLIEIPAEGIGAVKVLETYLSGELVFD